MMKKWLILIYAVLVVFSLTACSAQVTDDKQETKETMGANNMAENGQVNKQIKVIGTNGEVIVFELNNSLAAEELYNQLPLDVKVENFSNNEKIFYPQNELNTDNAPLAHSGVGTLAYYEPWGDVVMFYGDFHSNSSLYKLGQVVSGGEAIANLSGTITIEKIE